MHPADYASGDYYDYIPMRHECLGLAIADVCGHGLGPALLMASTQAFLRSSAETCDDAGEILGRVNRCLLDVAEQDRFVTLFFGRLDPRNRTLTYCNAGHPPAYVLDASGVVKTQLECTTMPLAIAPDTEFPLGSMVSLEAGDTLLLLTDGILEATSPEGKLFGMDRVLESIRAAQTCNAAGIIDRLFKTVREFCGTDKLLDDMTAIVIRVDGEESNATSV
jgi:sigma-B regulation protein RsbU (phosphoserine phosphatase)